MPDVLHKVAVTAPAFCRSPVLREELLQVFPNAYFNDKDRYLSPSETIGFLKEADAAVIGRDRIDEEVLNHLPGLQIIAKYGVGLDNIDQASARRHGVKIGWTAGVNKESVAELALCFMLGLCHNVFISGNLLKQNIWKKNGGRQLAGKTVGIIGCGHVGTEVLRLLSLLGSTLLVCDIVDKSEVCRKYGAEIVAFDALIVQADIVSLHVPLTEQTEYMIGAAVLNRMKTSAFLINTSRGRVVDEAALKAALMENRIAGAALDVFNEEPPSDQELLTHPHFMGTPHIGGNTQEAVEAMGRAAIAHLKAHFGVTHKARAETQNKP